MKIALHKGNPLDEPLDLTGGFLFVIGASPHIFDIHAQQGAVAFFAVAELPVDIAKGVVPFVTGDAVLRPGLLRVHFADAVDGCLGVFFFETNLRHHPVQEFVHGILFDGHQIFIFWFSGDQPDDVVPVIFSLDVDDTPATPFL